MNEIILAVGAVSFLAFIIARCSAQKESKQPEPETDMFPIPPGYVYEALEDIEISYLIAWKAPFSTGGKAVLKKGERVIAQSSASDTQAKGLYAKPVNYKELEERIVPESDRKKRKYGGFHFIIDTSVLLNKFKPVQ